MSDTHVPEIAATDAARLAEAGEVLLLDVREPHEWDAGHAAGAVHLPLGALDLRVLPSGRPLVMVCRSGNRSGKATAALVAAGYDARNMVGGMQSWAASGLAVVRDDGGQGHVA
ncbi:MAG: rhodanese-like domain-containing protein [Mycobacteriales bacterium]